MKNLLIILFALLGPAAFVQNISFTGSWQINKAKIDFSQIPDWGVAKGYQITQDKDRLNIKELWLDEQHHDHETSVLLKFDGAVTNQTIYTGKKRNLSLKWGVDGSSFTLTMHTTTADDKPWNDITETWRLTNEGKTLSVNREVKQLNNGYTYSIKLYYEKRP